MTTNLEFCGALAGNGVNSESLCLVTRPSARAQARLFANLAQRRGKPLDAAGQLALALLLEALQRALDDGSVCLVERRYKKTVEDYQRARTVQESQNPRGASGEGALQGEQAGAEGEPCAPAAVLPLKELALRLAACGLAVVRKGSGPMADAPLVFDVSDEGAALYVERSFYEEQRLARAVAQLADAAAVSAPPQTPEDPAQRAVRLAREGRLAVVSGGPGTGKTTIVTSVLAAILSENPRARILLAAPTGKAAGRMQQAVLERAGSASSDPGVLARLRSLRASTIHRLLMTRQDDGSRPGPESPLDADVLVVDESSMIDMGLAIRLFDAIDLSRTRVVLLGDRHQLAAVGPGSVFADLSDARGRLAPHIAQLVVSHRFAADKAIGRLSALVNAGRVRETCALLEELQAADGADEDNAVRWHEAGGAGARTAQPLTPAAKAWIDLMMQTIIRAVREHAADFASGVDAGRRLAAAQELASVVRSFGVLAAQRQGPMSVEAVNREAEERLEAEGFSGRLWRQIIVRSNDPVTELYNGDVGIVVPGSADDGESIGPEVFFPETNRFVKAGLLPAWDPAFAITIHQSQGSEYHHVAVLLPLAVDSPLATRELLYTAMTRVSDIRTGQGVRYGTLDLFAPRAVLERAIRTPVVREGGLARRLQETAVCADGADDSRPL